MSSIIYVTDTNLFRYLINKNQDQRVYRQAAIDFWTQIMDEASKGDAEIIIPEEVAQELKIQMHSFDESVCQTIQSMIDMLQGGNFRLPIELEYELREFSNYIIKSTAIR